MWEKEKAAYAAGKRIQFKISESWHSVGNPTWDSALSYRIHPDDDKQEKNFMQLEVGKEYISRDGKHYITTDYSITGNLDIMIGHIKGNPNACAAWYTSNGCLWLDGRQHANDLVELVVLPTKEEIAAALDLLKRVGDVTFKPQFIPFSKKVKLNDSYTAKVSNERDGSVYIKVGCQSFTGSKVEELYAVVQEARKHIKEQQC